MVEYTWPAVPHRFLRAGFEHDPGDPVERSSTDSGRARQRAVFTATDGQHSGTIRMTRAEYLVFQTWRNDLKGAVFTRPHPVTGEAGCRCRFVAGKQGAARPDTQTPKWLVPVVLEEMG